MINTAALPDPSFLALQTALAGRFSLESELGRGGMGVVYLARDVLLERPVAIKLLAPHLAAREDMRRRFLREARIAAQCFHPNIVPIHEVAESGDLAWFVMGYVQGETLAERLRRVGPLPADMVRRIGREIGWALSYAHQRGVVHRDVKPENILLEQGTGRALIADFGIAWHEPGTDGSRGVLVSGEVMGTARYMAPEQAMGDAIDGRTDLYALGVTLFLAATGRYPFDGRTALAVVAQQHASMAPSVRTHAPRLPANLADAIDQCLAASPAERFDSAAAFVAALERTPDGGELPMEARAARAAVVGTMGLLDWTIAIAYASFFMVMGEEARSLGRAIMISIAQSVLAFGAMATALRAVETVLAARRALQQGASPDDVTDAIAPPPTPPLRTMGPLLGTGMLAVASTLALAQGAVDGWQLPTLLEVPAAVMTWLAPTILVQRAISGMRRSSGLSGWLYAFVRQPMARRLVGWLGGGAARSPRPLPADAPTEVVLGQAAAQILSRLPREARERLEALPAAAAALADQAVALRARATAISGEQRRLRAEPADRQDEQRAALEREHAEVQKRLATTIAALESIRLDLLRLEAGQTMPGSLTEQLDVVRELQRQVDAMDDVRRVLRDPSLTPV